MAQFAKKHNLKVFYYISPKLWAWKENRVKKIKKFVDELFTILPFETEFYKNHGVDVRFVGNPTLDAIKEFRHNALSENEFRSKNHLDNRPVVALLAGSRIQEIKRILPTMVESTMGKPDFQFVIGGISSIERRVYQEIIGDKPVKLLFDQTYDLLNYAHTALVTSGTAALETALFEVPQVVLYKVEGGRVMNFIGWTFLIKTKWVSLPNIVLQEELIKELIQVNMTLENVTQELNNLLYDKEYRYKIKNGYKRLIATMGEPGCSKRAAQDMVSLLAK
jgi:lipid-A-disaccharide synthase